MPSRDTVAPLYLAARNLLDWLDIREGYLVYVRDKCDAESLDTGTELGDLCRQLHETLLDHERIGERHAS